MAVVALLDQRAAAAEGLWSGLGLGLGRGLGLWRSLGHGRGSLRLASASLSVP